MKEVLPLTRAFIGRFLSAAGVIALSIILARQLSLSEAGIFFGMFISLMGLSIAFQFGTPLILLRKVAGLHDSPTEADGVFSRTISNLAAVCVIVTILWVGFIALIGAGGKPQHLILLNILPTTLMGPISAYLKAKNCPGWGGFWEVGVLSLIAFMFVLVLRPTNAIEAWLVFSAACWIGMIIAVLHAGPRHLRALTRPSLDISLLLEGRFLWGMSVLSYVALWGGVAIAKWFLEADATAVLNALFRTLAPIQFLILTIDFYMAPKFAAASVATFRALYTKARVLCAVLVIPYALITLTMPSAFLTLMYGQPYGAFSTELRIVIIATIIQIAIGPSGILLNMNGQDRITLYCMGLKTVLYLTLSLLLVVDYGIMGIIVSLSIAIIVQAFLQYYIVARIYFRAAVN